MIFELSTYVSKKQVTGNYEIANKSEFVIYLAKISSSKDFRIIRPDHFIQAWICLAKINTSHRNFPAKIAILVIRYFHQPCRKGHIAAFNYKYLADKGVFQ